MGLFQQAVKTYDCQRSIVGEYIEGQSVLAPVSHITTKLDIVITIDDKGGFKDAYAMGKDSTKVIIPVTLESMGRTSVPSAHPLCEQIEYIAGYNTNKRQLYESLLGQWVQSSFSHPKAKAVLNYVINGTIVSDLSERELIDVDDRGIPTNSKIMIGWNVIGLGENSGPCWQDKSLMKAFFDYYQSVLDEDVGFCMLSGKNDILTRMHMKGIVPLFGNAKLISSNDKKNFTHRGRFKDDREALSVGYLSSQKAHNALKWLIENQGVIQGNRVFLCWNPEGRKLPQLLNPLLRRDEDEIIKPSDYRDRLRHTITGFKSENGLKGDETVVIASFDAATTGRLSITWYNELSVDTFIKRMKQWDEICCISDSRWGVIIPSIYEIVRCAYGLPRDNGMPEVDERILKQQVSRLMMCRIDGLIFPFDIKQAIVNRASTPLAYKNTKIRSTIIRTACAVIRKYHYDNHNGEELSMSLEIDRKDRSYQYGRLLAVMEKAERDTYTQNETTSREPNAIRMWTVFTKRPEYATGIIMKQLKSAYYPRLGSGSRLFYEREIGGIMERLSVFSPEELRLPLEDTYLMGYYMEKNSLYTAREKKSDE